MARRLLAAATLGVTLGPFAGVLLAPAPSGAATTTATSAPPASSTTAPTVNVALLGDALTAAKGEQSVHFVATSGKTGRSETVTESTSPTAGIQRILLRTKSATGHVSGVFMNQIVYFRGDAFGLEGYLGMPATLAGKYAGRWIFFSPATKDYGPIEKTFTLDGAISQINMKGPYRRVTATVDGQPAITVTGTMVTKTKKKAKKTKGAKVTLAVAATGTPLPIRFTEKGTPSAGETGTVDFSKWGLKVAPKAPQGAIAASSIESTG